MNEIVSWSQLFMESLQSFGSRFMGAVPGILAAFFILLVGWLIAKLMSSAVKQLLKLLKIDAFADRIKANELLERANITRKPSELIARFIYWLLMLLVIMTAADTVGWTAVTQEISKLIAWLPSLLAAIVFFIVGMYLAGFVRDIIRGATASLGIGTGRLVSQFIFYLLAVVVTITSLDQGGLDTSVLQSNLLLIIGSILLAAAISYGWASREILTNLLSTTFGKRTIKVGQKINFNGNKGEVINISSINVILRLEDNSKLVVPASQLINQPYIIYDGQSPE
ncbi:MAG: mechanosensitive ion channel [Saprospiraceae bacterium]|nr:mechanosensitive ion channel [Saprospiraceae bacterium]